MISSVSALALLALWGFGSVARVAALDIPTVSLPLAFFPFALSDCLLL